MSMNLHCDQVELWQTPTYITYMCMSNEDGGWRGVKYRYIEWVKSHLNGAWSDVEDYEWQKEKIAEHIADLNSFDELTFRVC